MLSDAWIGVAGTLLGTILGSILGYIISHRQKRVEERQKRRALATALLGEVCYLEDGLAQLYEMQTPVNSIGPLRTSIYDGIGSDLLLFSPETVRAITHFYYLTHNVLNYMEEARTRNIEPGKILHYAVRAGARSAAKVIAEVKSSLEREGGYFPGSFSTELTSYPDLPPFPPRVFESFDPRRRAGTTRPSS